MQLTDQLKEELRTVFSDLSVSASDAVDKAVEDIAYFTQIGLTTGDVERSKRNIHHVLSTLAGHASIQATTLEVKTRAALIKVLSSVAFSLV